MFWVGLGGAFLITLLSAIMLVALAPRLGLIAYPGGHRHHRNPTPMVGGLAIFLGLLFAVMLMDGSYLLILPSLALLCLIGVVDDRSGLPSWVRFAAQALAAYLMIKLTGVQLTSLGFVFSLDQEVLLGRWATPLTIFATIGVINAINMSDGSDGLAGSMVVLVLLALIAAGSNQPQLLYVSLASVAAFLVLNVRVFRASAKIYLGDAGSTVLGLILAYLLIQTSQADDGIHPVTALWLLTLPLIDAVAVLIVRPLRGRSPFAADRIHYHHLLADKGLSVNGLLIAALVIQSLFIGLGFLLRKASVPEYYQLIAFLSLFFIYLLTITRFTRDES